MGTKVVSSGELGIQASVGKDSVTVVVVVVDGTHHVEAEVAETHTYFAVVENTRTVGVVAVAETKSRTVNWGDCLIFLTRRKDREWVSGVLAGDKIVVAVEAVECKIVKVVDGIEWAEMALYRSGLVPVQDLTKHAGSGIVGVVVVTWW